jgi:hypothetical protein
MVERASTFSDWPEVADPIVLPPQETLLPEAEVPDGFPLELGRPARLPHVFCRALFQGISRKGRDEHLTAMTIHWWQDGLAMPISDEPIDQIRALDWEVLASLDDLLALQQRVYPPELMQMEQTSDLWVKKKASAEEVAQLL